MVSLESALSSILGRISVSIVASRVVRAARDEGVPPTVETGQTDDRISALIAWRESGFRWETYTEEGARYSREYKSVHPRQRQKVIGRTHGRFVSTRTRDLVANLWNTGDKFLFVDRRSGRVVDRRNGVDRFGVSFDREAYDQAAAVREQLKRRVIIHGGLSL